MASTTQVQHVKDVLIARDEFNADNIQNAGITLLTMYWRRIMGYVPISSAHRYSTETGKLIGEEE